MTASKIFVVEDDMIVARHIQVELTRFNYCVQILFPVPDNFLEVLEHEKPDLMLMDISLGEGFDGVDLAEQIREQLGIPVVFLTAMSDVQTIQRAKGSQPYGYITKPFEPSSLHATIEMAIQKNQVEKKLKESEARFRQIVETSQDGIVMLNLSGMILYANRQFEVLTGQPEGALTGRCIGDCVYSVHVEKLNQVIQLLSNGHVSKLELYLQHPDGQPRFVIASLSPICDQSGQVENVLAMFTDITERKLAEEERMRLATIVESSDAAILSVDLYGSIQTWNNGAESIYGYSQEEVHRVSCSVLLPRTNLTEFSELLQRIQLTRSSQSIESTHRRKNGEEFYVSIIASPLLNSAGRLVGMSIVARDITENRWREQNLQAIAQTTTALRNVETIDQAITVVLQQVDRLLNVKAALVMLLDKEVRHFQVRSASGSWQPLIGRTVSATSGESIALVKSYQPRINLSAEDDVFPPMRAVIGDIRYVSGFPLQSKANPVGVLWLGRDRPLIDDEVSILHSISDIAATTLSRIAFQESTQLQVKRLATLRMIDIAINSSLNLKIAIEVLVEQIIAQLGAEGAAIFQLDSADQFIGCISKQGAIAEPDNFQQTPHFMALVKQAMQKSRTVRYLPPNGSEYLAGKSQKCSTHFIVPLLTKSRMRGVLIVCVGDPFMPNREWTSFLETLAGQAAIAIDNITLFEDLQRSNRDLSQAYDETIEGWAKALELRDLETQGHCARVANLTLQLAASMGVPEEEFDSIRRGALLHDIGKMGIPDDILKKAGPLTEKDWKIMKEHPVYAYDLLAKVDFLKSSLDIPFCHHEHWDGTGYPRGLKGADIPLSARIFTVVDVWDALSSDRPYRKPMERDEIVRYIQSQSGIQFDPDVVDAFITLVEHTQTVFMAGPLESEVAPVDWAGDSH